MLGAKARPRSRPRGVARGCLGGASGPDEVRIRGLAAAARRALAAFERPVGRRAPAPRRGGGPRLREGTPLARPATRPGPARPEEAAKRRRGRAASGRDGRLPVGILVSAHEAKSRRRARGHRRGGRPRARCRPAGHEVRAAVREELGAWALEKVSKLVIVIVIVLVPRPFEHEHDRLTSTEYASAHAPSSSRTPRAPRCPQGDSELAGDLRDDGLELGGGLLRLVRRDRGSRAGKRPSRPLAARPRAPPWPLLGAERGPGRVAGARERGPSSRKRGPPPRRGAGARRRRAASKARAPGARRRRDRGSGPRPGSGEPTEQAGEPRRESRLGRRLGAGIARGSFVAEVSGEEDPILGELARFTAPGAGPGLGTRRHAPGRGGTSRDPSRRRSARRHCCPVLHFIAHVDSMVARETHSTSP